MKGILFKPDMHKAIKEDRKTVTRRLNGLKEINQEPDAWINTSRNATGWVFQCLKGVTANATIIKPRYYAGEVVYIKEAWCVGAYDGRTADLIYKLDTGANTVEWNTWLDSNTIYGSSNVVETKWRSPLFMPTWAARDFIRITDVKPERLQEITEEDAEKEGVMIWWSSLDGRSYDNAERLVARFAKLRNPHAGYATPKDKYAVLWDSINKKNPWSTDPWVFRYEFKREHAKIKAD